jgi:hypothetical protein
VSATTIHGRGSNARGWLTKAARDHYCGSGRHRDEGCLRRIGAGSRYVRSVAFPDGDVNPTSAPWTMRLCEPCAEFYGYPVGGAA